MSVIINSTTLNFYNNTEHLLEINIESDQDDTFHVKTNDEMVVQRISEEPSSLVAHLFNLVYGSNLSKVILNLGRKKTSKIIINSKSCLEINYEVKIPNSNEHISGYLPINSDFQGQELFCTFFPKKGICYDSNNNVAILGQTDPCKQDLIITAQVKSKNDEDVFVDEYQPAMCKLIVNEL